MRLSAVDRLLEYFEENIDLEHIRKIEKLNYEALNYGEVPFLPLTIRTAADGFERFPLEDAFDNPEKMLYNELLSSTFHSSYNSVRTKDHCALQIRSNHGIGIIASLFGCKSSVFNNEMPWVSHISLDDAKKAFAGGVPDLNQALGKKVVDTCSFYHERLKSYPRTYQAVHITQPDMQGPFDIFHLILGNDCFLLVHDDPQFCREALEVITETYIRFREFVNPLLTDNYNGDAVFVHGFLCGGKVILKNDTAAINLSETMYHDFETVWDERVYEHFAGCGGGALHYCGPERDWHYREMSDKNLRAINFGNPEMHSLEKAYNFWRLNNTAIVGWGVNEGPDHLEKVYSLGISTGMQLMAVAGSAGQGKEIVKRHEQRMAEGR
ncbi:MAG: hypothetical protein E4H36_09415 [Spirochaetales bacterium]|nr:MAG: hypothetical protein E4H36_09415 [Spirochaetales bacterium]